MIDESQTLSFQAAQVGRPCHFSIDAANAGAGNMEIIVSVDKKNVPNFVQVKQYHTIFNDLNIF